MEPIEFPVDFSEFLKLLNVHRVEFLLIGGLAVSHHGYPRSTSDMDVWVRRSKANAEPLVAYLRQFGFDTPKVAPELFDDPNRIVRSSQSRKSPGVNRCTTSWALRHRSGSDDWGPLRADLARQHQVVPQINE